MKKLLVLALVLSVASVASATLTLTPSGPIGSEAIALVSNPIETIDQYVAISVVGDNATLAAFVTGADGGTMNLKMGDGTELGLPNGEIWALAIGVPPEVYKLGTLLTTAVTRDGLATATITLYSYDGDVTLTEMSNIVLPAPEPMTMALLGLGGLFLRRRSK